MQVADRGKRLHYRFEADECHRVRLVCKACAERPACQDGGCTGVIAGVFSTRPEDKRIAFLGETGGGWEWKYDNQHQHVLVECVCPRCRHRLTRLPRRVDVPEARIRSAMPTTIDTTARLLV